MKINFISVGFSCLILTSCATKQQEKTETPNLLVTLPETKDTTVYNEYVGQIRAIQHIELRALDEGYLHKIYVDEGQRVKAGQLIFQILPTVYQAEKEKAKAEAEFAKIEYLNTKALSDSGIVSSKELALSKAKLDKSKAELSLANARLGFTEIRAPFNGIIGRFKDVRLGSLLEGGELLTALSDNSKMWVYFNVPESEYLNFVSMKGGNQNINKEVKLKMANGQYYNFTGKVEVIEADFNNETGNIAFRATFENPNSLLRHGQTGKIFMPRKLEKAMLIPQKATFEILDKKYVYVLRNHKVQAQQIEVGSEIPHIYIVTKGLTNRDTVLVEGLRKVKNGDEIETHFKPQEQIVQDLIQLHAE